MKYLCTLTAQKKKKFFTKPLSGLFSKGEISNYTKIVQDPAITTVMDRSGLKEELIPSDRHSKNRGLACSRVPGTMILQIFLQNINHQNIQLGKRMIKLKLVVHQDQELMTIWCDLDRMGFLTQ